MKVRRKEQREARLYYFTDFISEETMPVNDPLFSKEPIEQYNEKRSSRQENTRKRFSTFVTSSKKDDISGLQKVEMSCIACGKSHTLDTCEHFMKKTLREKAKLLAKEKCCYASYQPMSKNHNAKNCTQRLVCRTCKENHQTGMHEYCVRKCKNGKDGSLTERHFNESKESVKCASVNGKLEAEVISMCVVPIWVGHKNSTKMFKTYAMLDNCSQVSFIRDDLIEDLQITGRKLQLSLKTLTGEKLEDTMAIDGLIVSGIDLKKTRTNEWIELPRTYSKQSLPVEREEIATPNKIKKWDYLKSISREITQQDDIEIGILIGANCMKALEPLEIISSRNDGPHAYRTKLGWCIVGPIVNKSSNKSVKCNRMAVKDVISGKVASHNFKIDNRLKRSKICVKEMFERIFHNDFSEVKQLLLNIIGKTEEISREDKKFLKILETGTKKNGNHYKCHCHSKILMSNI